MGISLTRSLKDGDLLQEVVVYERWSHIMEVRLYQQCFRNM